MKLTKKYIILFIISVLSFACANRGPGPTGGAKDITPPKIVKETPANGSLNFNKKKIEIVFDENISLEKVSENVIVSPPQKKSPVINAYGKTLHIEFNDTLFENTTYSIDFGSAVVDLNEKNPFSNFVFAFSTGNEIDTLKIAGTVLNAENLNPLAGVFVGIYSEMSDSVFAQKPFLRVARTDTVGNFTVNNVKAGSYQIFALGDLNRDYFYQPSEGLAFYDTVVTPTVETALAVDTLWRDSVTVDTIVEQMKSRFFPENVLLQYFKENKKRQYLVKNERKNERAFTLFFNTKADSLPEITPINFEWENKFLLQKNLTLDTLTYWLTDSNIWKMDTLKMQINYLKTDSLYTLQPTTDTINVIFRKTAATRRPTRNQKTTPFLTVKTNIASTFEIYTPVSLQFEEPVDSIFLEKIQLSEKVDTVYKTLLLNFLATDSSKMCFSISHKWESEKEYQLKIDSAAIKSIYGLQNNKYAGKFKIRSIEEYSSVRAFIEPYNQQVILQLLNEKDAVVATQPASEKGALFEYLKPGNYYLRMFIDENGNGMWDTGSFFPRHHAEQVYYFVKKLTLMANWEFEETWENWSETPLTQQKPRELIKNEVGKK